MSNNFEREPLTCQLPDCRYYLRLLKGALLLTGVAWIAGLYVQNLSAHAEGDANYEAFAVAAGITWSVGLASSVASGIGWLAYDGSLARVKTFRFGLRDALWGMVVLGLCLGWWVDHKRDSWIVRPMDRSWLNGTVALVPYTDPTGKEMGLRVIGGWPDASPDLWIRASCYLIQDDSPPELAWGTLGRRLTNVYRDGISDYSRGPLRRLAHPNQPHQAVYDYEIWSGKPGRSRLLAKNSVISQPITPPQSVGGGQAAFNQN